MTGSAFTSGADGLFEQYGKGIWQYIYSITQNRDVTDDLTQDVFVRVCEHFYSFRGHSSAKTWLYAIARNRCRDYFRSSFVRRVVLRDDPYGNEAISSAEDDVIRGIEQSSLVSAVLRLKRIYREVVILRLKEEMTFAEISQVTGVPEGVLKMRYYRGIRQLRIYLEREFHLNEC